MMINNMLKFYHEMVGLYNVDHTDRFVPSKSAELELDNVMDTWILTCLQDLIVNVGHKLESYQLSGIVNMFLHFINQLSKWYVNLNKDRFKNNSETPLTILNICLTNFAVLSAPFAPFLSEIIYHSMGNEDCVHHQSYPPTLDLDFDTDNNLLTLFDYFSDIVDLVRMVRGNRKFEDGKPACSVKLSLPKVTIVNSDNSVLNNIKSIENYITSQLNIDNIVYSDDMIDCVNYSFTPNMDQIKTRVNGKQIGSVIKTIKQLDYDGYCNYPYKNEVKIVLTPKKPNVVCTNLITIEYDDNITQEITERYYCNMFYREYQDTRKKAGLVQSDKVDVYVVTSNSNMDLINKYKPDFIYDWRVPSDYLYHRTITIEGTDPFHIYLV